MLTAEGHKFVLTEAYLDNPTSNASEEERQQIDRCKKSDKMAKCYNILGAI